METITKVEKETIPSLSFGSEEILNNATALTKRKVSLAKALTLGNGQKRKVKIYFNDENGRKYVVETTIWSVGPDFISLKAGVSIPIESISEIEF